MCNCFNKKSFKICQNAIYYCEYMFSSIVFKHQRFYFQSISFQYEVRFKSKYLNKQRCFM